MHAILKYGVLVLAVFLLLSLFHTEGARAQDSAPDKIYDAPGLDPNRETLSSIAEEHIDPFTGGVLISNVDAWLPGNGGLDLVIRRTYNSKNICNRWAAFPNPWYCEQPGEMTSLGYGWNLHFGRFFRARDFDDSHFVEMPDGSIHTLYKMNYANYITKDYWLGYVGAGNIVLTLTDGTRIYFDELVPNPTRHRTHTLYLATAIEDVNGNTIEISYTTFNNATVIDYVVDTLSRTVEFTYEIINSSPRLTAVTGPGIHIDYEHESTQILHETFLKRVHFPEGPPWEYSYDHATAELKTVKTPYGGVIEYAYDMSLIYNATGLRPLIRTLVEKKTGGRQIPAGTWTFQYSQGQRHEFTDIRDPDGRMHRYRYYGYGSALPYGSMWKLGLPKSKEIVGEELTVYEWEPSLSISSDDYWIPTANRSDFEIYVPLLRKTSYTRDGKAYTTEYASYDDYGNPGIILETGDQRKTTAITYWYNFSENIVKGKPSSETVSGSQPGTFSTDSTYDIYGNLLSINKHGVIIRYTRYPNGNLKTETDANGNTTTYGWAWGKISRITTPQYTIYKSINKDSTVKSETNGRGYITSYLYDGNLRLKRITPPIGNPTTFNYHQDNWYKLEQRGGYFTYHFFDGFGRPVGTKNITGVESSIVYSRSGIKHSETSNIGDTVYYDYFGRVQSRVHKDGTSIAYSYTRTNTTIVDEAGFSTELRYNAFGNPDEKLLVAVKDAGSVVTTYDYNILGSLLSIQQGSLSRSFGYDSRNFLVRETHPEKGTITYTRDGVGNLKTMTDGLGTVSYFYDGLNRLTRMQSGWKNYIFVYDAADNRTQMRIPADSMVANYTYDAANRLTAKREKIRNWWYQTSYTYDGNDNVTQLVYPSGRQVRYTYNNKNQVTSIDGFGAHVLGISYYAEGTHTGRLRHFDYYNGYRTTYAYTARNLPQSIRAGGVLNLAYGYDSRGNLTSITDHAFRLKDQSLGYDDLNRLVYFSGPWGNGYFSYHFSGDRRTKWVGRNTTYYYDNYNRLRATEGGENFTFRYDDSGNVIHMGIGQEGFGINLYYDPLHPLRRLARYTHNGEPIIRAQFLYDADGKKVSKTISRGRGFTTDYFYDQTGQLISEYHFGAGVGKYYFVDYVYLNGNLVAKAANNDIYHFYTDRAGTPLAMTDKDKRIIWRADYKPFGEVYKATLGLQNNRLFLGKERDEETGLYDFGARHMEAKIGRFLSTDPVGPVDPQNGKVNEKVLLNPQRLNPYAYALNNPYRYVDPDGYIPIDTLWDLGNIIYDVLTGDWSSLATDSAAFFIPYVPAGLTKVGKGLKFASKSKQAAKTRKFVIFHDGRKLRWDARSKRFVEPDTGKTYKGPQGDPWKLPSSKIDMSTEYERMRHATDFYRATSGSREASEILDAVEVVAKGIANARKKRFP